MQFYSTVAVVAISLTSAISAFPTTLEERQTNTINTISTSVKTLQVALAADEAVLSKISSTLSTSILTY
jgi:hypothetical protein